MIDHYHHYWHLSTLPVLTGDKVALIGTSHTAGLVAMHLHEMNWPVQDLTVFGQYLWVGGCICPHERAIINKL